MPSECPAGAGTWEADVKLHVFHRVKATVYLWHQANKYLIPALKVYLNDFNTVALGLSFLIHQTGIRKSTPHLLHENNGCSANVSDVPLVPLHPNP